MTLDDDAFRRPRRTTSPLLINRMLSSVCLPATVNGGMLNGVFGLTVSSIGVGNVGPRRLTTASGANGGRFRGLRRDEHRADDRRDVFRDGLLRGLDLEAEAKRMMSSFARKRSFVCADTCVVPMLASAKHQGDPRDPHEGSHAIPLRQVDSRRQAGCLLDSNANTARSRALTRTE
jgi:hypothetical protein